MLTVVKGTSGATVYVTPRVTVKVCETDDANVRDRIVAQGTYMQSGTSKWPFPRVHIVFASGYAMDTLTPLTLNDDMSDVVHWLIETMIAQPVVEKTWAKILMKDSHRAYVQHVCRHAPAAKSAIDDLDRSIHTPFVDVPVIETHGDLTVDNVLWDDETEQYAVVDPLPYSSKMPRLRAVDAAKILQSIRGYEAMRYRLGAQGLGPWAHDYDPVGLERDLMGALDSDQERLLTEYFWCVHMVRLLPYQRPVVAESLRAELYKRIKAGAFA